jgi:hypothetical protein
MKTRLTTLALLTVTIVLLASCATGRSKYGCPATAYNYKHVNKI